MLIGINGGYFPAICRVCFIYQARKLEVAESNTIMENISIAPALSVGWGFLPSLSRSRFISLSHSISPFLLMSHFSCCYVV